VILRASRDLRHVREEKVSARLARAALTAAWADVGPGASRTAPLAGLSCDRSLQVLRLSAKEYIRDG